MAIDLKIPSIGESITEVQIAEWLKAEGDAVKKDETVAVIDSEKSTLDLPAPESGRLTKILHAAGERVKVGDVVAQIETGGGDGAEKDRSTPGKATIEAEAKTASAAEASRETKASGETIPAENLDVTDDKTKPPGRADLPVSRRRGSAGLPEQPTTKSFPADPNEEVQKFSDQSAQSAVPGQEQVVPSEPREAPHDQTGREIKRVPMTMLRRTIARRLVEAKQQMAMLTTFNEADMSAIMALRKEHQEAFTKRHGFKLGIMSFFVNAAVDALKQFPALNAEVRGEEILYPAYCDIGVAIGSERGLVVPVLHNAEKLDFADVEKAIADFAARARDGRIKPDELAGGTFTITNGGVFGSLFSTPIINPPQSGILGMHTIQERPVAVAGQVVIRPMMFIALTYDHRIVDGREAVLFLQRIKEVVENPARLLIGI
jgi:2-oxoglutarate dehydrogenase E2 component (dihydrolipoamide succinyltransferase)